MEKPVNIRDYQLLILGKRTNPLLATGAAWRGSHKKKAKAMRQKTDPKTKAQCIGQFCYNCAYSLIGAFFCATSFDRHQTGRGPNTIHIVSPVQARWTGGICTFFCGLGLYFMWRQWWRDAQTVRWRGTD